MNIEPNNDGIRVSVEENSWRMVYNDTKVLHLFESAGITSTIQNLYIGESKEECINYAKSLGIELLPESN